MLNFIPWVLLVLQNKESSDLGISGTLPGLCHKNFITVHDIAAKLEYHITRDIINVLKIWRWFSKKKNQ